jgi:hypothetical protein
LVVATVLEERSASFSVCQQVPLRRWLVVPTLRCDEIEGSALSKGSWKKKWCHEMHILLKFSSHDKVSGWTIPEGFQQCIA